MHAQKKPLLARVGRLSVRLAVASASAGAFAAGEITLGTGVDYSTGKYGGASATDILYVPGYAKYENDRLTLKATTSYLRITGLGTIVLIGDRPVTVTSPNARRTTAAGLGDVVFSAGYAAYESYANGVLIEVLTKIKLPTADKDKGLGTGKTDYALQIDAVKQWGSLSLLGSIGYRWLGSPPGLELRDVWYVSTGAALKLTTATSVGLLYDYRQRSIATGSAQNEVTAYVSQRIATRTKLQLYAVGGLADGSPDWGGGLMITQSF
jgi:hypothetical protein